MRVGLAGERAVHTHGEIVDGGCHPVVRHLVPGAGCAVMAGGSNGDGAWRGLVTIVELLDPRPYTFQVTVYSKLIYTMIYMSDRLSTHAPQNPRLPLPIRSE
jgi:hypothetical protein